MLLLNFCSSSPSRKPRGCCWAQEEGRHANNYSTRSAVLTGAAAENINDINNSRSFISLFKNAGYNTVYFTVYNSLLSKDALAYNIVKNNTNNDEYSQYIDYIDAYLHETINILADKKAFIILQGLEGEKYKDKLSASKDRASVMIVWVSDKLNKEYNISGSITAHKNDAVLDDTLFNTLSGCFQMDSSVFNNGRNLCRKN